MRKDMILLRLRNYILVLRPVSTAVTYIENIITVLALEAGSFTQRAQRIQRIQSIKGHVSCIKLFQT